MNWEKRSSHRYFRITDAHNSLCCLIWGASYWVVSDLIMVDVTGCKHCFEPSVFVFIETICIINFIRTTSTNNTIFQLKSLQLIEESVREIGTELYYAKDSFSDLPSHITENMKTTVTQDYQARNTRQLSIPFLSTSRSIDTDISTKLHDMIHTTQHTAPNEVKGLQTADGRILFTFYENFE